MRRQGVVGAAGTAAAVLALGAAVVAGAGCGASRPTSTEAAAAETAETVCATLRRWNNELTDLFNATSQQITDDDDPDTAGDVLVAGFDEMIAVAEAHVAEAEDLVLPAEWGDDLRAELTAGAEESLAVLEEERAQAADLPPIEIDDQGGAIGGASVGLERATSVLEPQAGAYDAVLGEAFTADEGCEHVIQPY
jgi:hypothetical protein